MKLLEEKKKEEKIISISIQSFMEEIIDIEEKAKSLNDQPTTEKQY